MAPDTGAAAKKKVGVKKSSEDADVKKTGAKKVGAKKTSTGSKSSAEADVKKAAAAEKKAAAAEKATAKKEAAKKKKALVTKKAALAKAAAAAKKKKAAAAKKAAQEKKRKIPEDMMPPRQPPSPFALFCQKTDKPKLTSLEEANKHMSDSGERWKAMSDAEKEPYMAEIRALTETYNLAKDEWWKNASATLIRAINAQRAAKKKPRLSTSYHRAQEDKKPPNQYSLFVADTIRNIVAKNDGVWVQQPLREVGERWRSMSDEDKAPWKKLADEKKAEWEARKAEKAQAVGSSSD